MVVGYSLSWTGYLFWWIQLPWFPAGMSYSEMCLQGIMVVVLITLKWIFVLMDTTTMVLRYVRPNERVILLCEPANIPSNPSRKLKLSKTLFQREEFENLGFLFSRGHKKKSEKRTFWKWWRHDSDFVWFFCASFPNDRWFLRFKTRLA